MPDIHFLIPLFFAYVLGSIPFGLLLVKAAGLGDIRKTGSGNIGATNVARSGHKWLGAATLLLDGAKGFAAVWLAQAGLFGHFAPVAGLCAVLGHVFPVWLGFKGGKGVATTLGVLLALNIALGIAVCALWLAAFIAVRVSSLAALLSIGYSSIVAYLLNDDASALLCLFLTILVLFTHHANISRLLHGTESDFRRRTV